MPQFTSSGRVPFYRTLYGQVLIATVAGVAFGYLFPSAGGSLRPLGDAFIRLIRMIVAPVVFCTVVVGIAGVGDVKALGKTGLLTLLYFEVVSTVALIIGLIAVNVLQPGVGMNVDASKLDPNAVSQYVTAGRSLGVSGFLLGIIPTSIVDAMARSDILQVLVFSVIFGLALNAIGPKGAPLFQFIDVVSRALLGLVSLIMKTAPIAAFGAMAATVGTFGVGTLTQLVKFIVYFYATSALFVAVVLGAIAWWGRFSIWRLIAYIREELFVAFGTSSSESAMPQIMAKLERLGVARSVVGLVIPAGYSLNLDGSAIYQAMAAVFIAQATNTPLPLGEQIVLVAVLTLTSKGVAGVAGAALVVLAGTLTAAGHVPVSGVVLVVGIHRFMGQAMAVTNTIGNSVAAIVIGDRCGQLDRVQLDRELGAEDPDVRSVRL
ncbi:MAG TPA: C4-dicarboxylate transporter DctA [Vicinamibacterales bacterium]|nr:C4-dicarboxylate transporter DctA [Vicinamibacterales bacterium]